jgi:hypothetical protein
VPGLRNSGAIPLLLWAFMAHSRENFTLLYFTLLRGYYRRLGSLEAFRVTSAQE